MTKRVAIIGAGPAGITAAYVLAKKGVQVEVFEAEKTAGGMAKTISLWNQRVDLGPHRFFSKDKRVNALWLEVMGQDYAIVNRLTRILYKEKFYSYPLNPLNALSNLGISEIILCIAYFLKEMILPTRQDGSFQTWVTHRFGKRLYEIFFKSYSEKLWGIPCSELDADFASQRIKKLSLSEAIKNALIKNSNNKHRTLVEQFAYPCLGTGAVYERMASYVQKNKGQIHYQTPIEKIIFNNGKACSLAFADGRIEGTYDHIISTMPLSLLLNHLPTQKSVKDAANFLKFRNTILVYLNVDTMDLFPDQWIYLQSPELRAGRITNFRNWTPQLYGQEKTSILAMEFWCNDEEPLWKEPSNNLIELAKKELKQIGFINAAVLDGHVIRIPRCYPIYRKGYKTKLKIIEDYLKTIEGLSVIGRYGSYKYNNQDHSILMGLLAAANIIDNGSYNLWEINTDYEDYQESYVITKTGLVSTSN